MERLVTLFLDVGSEKKALKQLMGLRSLERHYSADEMEQAAHTLLLTTGQPTVSVYKTILSRDRQRTKDLEQGKTSQPQTDNRHGFVRGAKYFGGSNQ